MYILACIFIYEHIFPLFIDGKGWDKGRECEKDNNNTATFGPQLTHQVIK